MKDEINWRRGNPDTSPSLLIGLLPEYYHSSYCRSKRLKEPNVEKGKKPIVVIVGDKQHLFIVPANVPLTIIKCAFLHYFGADAIYGNDGRYAAYGAKNLSRHT